MNLITMWWVSFVNVGPMFHAIFLTLAYVWAFALRHRRYGLAQTAAAATAFAGVIGTYMSLQLGLEVDISGGDLAEFQSFLALGPQTSMIGLSLYVTMFVTQKATEAA